MPKIDRNDRSGRGTGTRLRITTAAAELVAELGWDVVTTRAVAARAGVNPALIHYHFETMDALLRAAVIAALRAETAEAARPFGDGTFATGLSGAIGAVGRFDPGSPAAVLLIEAMVRAMRDPAIAEAIVQPLHEFRELVAARVRAAVAAGEIAPDVSAEAAGTLIAAALDGLLFQRIVDPTTDTAGVQELLLRLVGEPAPATRGGPS
jgi:AcrR family transcriptional regulator